MSKEEIKHDADLAGGDREVVFSSEGAAPVSIAFPVTTTSSSEDIVTSEEMSPEQAFEIFAGKLFAPNPYSKKMIPSPEEAPMQKLLRIQREMDELKHDLSSDAHTETSQLLQNQLSMLQDQFQKLSIERMKQQQHLSTSIQTTVERIGEPTGVSVGTTSSSSTPGVIPSTPSVKERLRHLEVLLGSGSGNIKNQNLLERLDQLERQYEKLDEKKLDVLHKRAKVIRQDLEAAAKARHKLNVQHENTGGDSMNAKKITALYDEMEQLRGMTGILPSLLSRLQTLAQIHTDAATHSARFGHVEQTVQMLQNTMAAMEISLEKLEQSLQTSAKTMQDNVQALEEQIRALA